jgi:hypothetical protein
VSSKQLVDGVDAFFADFRNRRILVGDGIWLVANSISGTPEKEMKELVESWRRNAVPGVSPK